MFPLIEILKMNLLLTLLYTFSGTISLILGILLLRYYLSSKKILAKYLGISVIFVGSSIFSYLYAFSRYILVRGLNYTIIITISVSNILIGISLVFLILYLHLAIFKTLRVALKLAYSTPILLMLYVILFIREIDALRLYLGYALTSLIILLMIYITYFIKISIMMYLDRNLIPELRLGAIIHIISMFLAIIAVGYQIIGKLYNIQLFSSTAIVSLFSVFLSITLLYLPTTLPSWYVRIAKKLMNRI